MQVDECKVQFTVQCVEMILTQIQNTTPAIPKEIIINTLDTVLNSTKILEDAASNQSQLVYYGNSILNATETLVSALIRKTDTDYWDNITLTSIEAAVFVLCSNSSLKNIPRLNTSTSFLEIDLIKVWKENKETDSVAFISYSNLSGFLKPTFSSTTNSKGNIMMSMIVTVKLLSTRDQSVPNKTSRPAHNTITDPSTNNDKQYFTITLEYTAPWEQGNTLHCMTWKETEWVHGLCEVTTINTSYATCSSLRPGTFALIMQTDMSLVYESWLDLINTIAVSVGLVFLSLALLTFVFCRRDMTMINTALINLCLSLFLAQLLFLLTQKFLLDILSKMLCAVMAGVLHFLFLSAFVWMFIEAVLLFLRVKNLMMIRSKQEDVLGWKYLMLTGYIIPLVVVGVSAGIFPDGYGSDQCWLKTNAGFFWSFLGPVCFILGVFGF
ncbi:adhesion G protein-coupled receptor E1-like isoform X2 [Hoplias malabaricus]|uniref:adhesion G protein-coupled receptor E1-like isoform X2 n=1 Tax=Hoplias malabaricus TaxID=27720 RepID=UPI0034626EBF